MQRTAPEVSVRTREYWHSGADGKLRICHCQDCGQYVHPPQPSCPECYGMNMKFDPVSGKGTIFTYTINRYNWFPNMPAPYVIADVELVEQEGLKILTNIVDIDPSKVKIGMSVSVQFDHVGETYIPLFAP